MKSTLKIDYQRGQENSAVIKIIVPSLAGLDNEPDEDVRDKLIRDFLHTPLFSEPNSLFETKEVHPINNESAMLTTIGAVLPDRILYKLRHILLNKFIPYDTLIKMNKNAMNKADSASTRTPYDGEFDANKINDFFDWVETLAPQY